MYLVQLLVVNQVRSMTVDECTPIQTVSVQERGCSTEVHEQGKAVRPAVRKILNVDLVVRFRLALAP